MSGFPGRFWAARWASSDLPEAHPGCSLRLFIFCVSVFLPFQRRVQVPPTAHQSRAPAKPDFSPFPCSLLRGPPRSRKSWFTLLTTSSSGLHRRRNAKHIPGRLYGVGDTPGTGFPGDTVIIAASAALRLCPRGWESLCLHPSRGAGALRGAWGLFGCEHSRRVAVPGARALPSG